MNLPPLSFKERRSEDIDMLISSSPRQLPVAAPITKPAIQGETALAAAPQESFTLSQSPKPGFYSPGRVLGRIAGGALTGVGAHYLTGGDVWATAKLGAAINGTIGAAAGAVIGGAGGLALGHPISGALIGAGTIGGISAVSGGIQGALVATVGNLFGGGALAYAASGAVLGAVGI